MPAATSIVDYQDDDHEAQLAELGVSSELLRHAALAGYTKGGEFTAHHPRIAAGFNIWAEMIATLRDGVAVDGWENDSTRNYETIRHPEGVCAISVASGTHETGTNGTPHTRTPKGAATRDIVMTNQQLSLFGPVPADEPGNRPMPTYLLLHRYDDDEKEIRLELSLPNDMTTSTITSWSRRIILEPVPFELDGPLEFPDTDDLDDDPPTDFDITRRQR